ncbi:LCP family protein [Streptomyces sp. ODS28]|uniref:LCP family protein n=1 Tax=Streptomyces sp. ODS28 TaxID=3136688 RepID=UPI0031EAE9F3
MSVVPRFPGSPRSRPPRSRPPRPRRALLAAAAGAALLCTAVPACSPGGDRPGDEQRGPGDGNGTNILITGLDQRRNMSDAEKDRLHVNGKECNCTDVMMLLHFSADRKRMSAVSIPRDSYVPFAKQKGAPERGKINAAFKHGGPKLAVRTVEKVTGVPVHGYADVDFPRFVKAVDEVGGSRVCTARPLWDENSGLDLKAGDHRLAGKESLRYVRARHLSPPGDLGRNRRQQYLVSGVLASLASGATASDPDRLARTVQAVRKHVHTDLSTGEMVGLARGMRGLTTRHMEFATVPMSDFDLRVPGWGSSLKWDDKKAAALFDDLRKDRSLTANPLHGPPRGVHAVSLPPATIPVQVVGERERAAKIEKGLRENGFKVLQGPVPASAPSGKSGTRITYNPANEPQAQAVATALPDAELRLEPGHSTYATVWAGGKGTRVRKVVEDRNAVEGAAVTGDKVGGCGGQGAHTAGS